jgi:hypothetical protein
MRDYLKQVMSKAQPYIEKNKYFSGDVHQVKTQRRKSKGGGDCMKVNEVKRS